MLQLLKFNPGVNREMTRYAAEGRWYDCDKVRFRKEYPEKIGGWRYLLQTTFQGVCRSIWNWVTLGNANFISLGTNLKFYLETGATLYDITPIRATTAAGDVTFSASSGSTTITVTDTAHGAITNDFVTFSSALGLGGQITADILNAEYQITVIDVDTYTIEASVAADGSDIGNGGASVVGTYQINTGPEFAVPLVGWGAGGWSTGTWGTSTSSTESLRVWSQSNFGEDLVFGPRGGGLYTWDASGAATTRAVNVTTLGGASNVPVVQNYILVSDISRFVFCFGSNDIGSSAADPMLVRWSDQESLVDWTPASTNQAGSLRLSRGSEIVTAQQARQEILTWTDSALYSLQYQGAPAVWGAQLVGDNISIASQNAVAYANGVAYWMGLDKFYFYNGTAQPLPSDVRRHVFDDFNEVQYDQVFAGTNEAFHEVWWFYCSSESTSVDRYVVFNYQLQIWYYGTMSRTAWLDSGLRNYPLATTYNGVLVEHEASVDDEETTTPVPIEAYIESADFDIDTGDRFGFIWRVLPDITFDGSSSDTPSATLELEPKANSGSGYNDPKSEGGSSSGVVTRSSTVPVEQYTQQVNVRVRGRQMSFKVSSDGLGVKWQIGTPRMDIRADGRR